MSAQMANPGDAGDTGDTGHTGHTGNDAQAGPDTNAGAGMSAGAGRVAPAGGLEAASSSGAWLRQVREQHGLTTEQVAEATCIRRVHIEAIEQGRHDLLPGNTYALGFVRTYAGWMGLDAGAVAERFRIEAGGLPTEQDLAFPDITVERRVPGLGVILAGLVVALLAWGGWYWLAEPRHDAAGVAGMAGMPPVPDQPGNATSQGMAGDAGSDAGPAPVGTANAPALTGEDETGPVPDIDPETSALVRDGLTAPGPDTSTSPAPDSTADNAGRDAPAQADDRAGAIVLEPPVVRPDLEPQGAQQGAPQGAAAADTAVIPPAPHTVAPPAPAPAVQPGVIVRASDTAWVQVRDDMGETLLSRLMRPGEEWSVPSARSGLSLVTGNAGAITILVDGQAVPSLGGPGEVVRDVSLARNDLLAR